MKETESTQIKTLNTLNTCINTEDENISVRIKDERNRSERATRIRSNNKRPALTSEQTLITLNQSNYLLCDY